MCSNKKAVLGGEGDYFRRLPDDVVLHIFNKLMDAKWLCRCSIVSKRFASLIPQIHTVSVTIPFQEFNSVHYPEPEEDRYNYNNFFLFFDQIVADAKPVEFTFRPLFRFLKSLKEIRCLSFEIPCYCEVDGKPVFQWKAKFGTKLESITFLLPTSLRPSEKEKEERETTENDTPAVVNCDEPKYRYRAVFAVACMLEARLWHAILLLCVAHLPSLRSVSITDSKKHGKLYISGQQLLQLMNSVDPISLSSLLDRRRIPKILDLKRCYVPVLRLPLSGYVMEETSLFMIKLVDSVDCDDDDSGGDVVLGSFQEEEDAFKEAVREILTKHKDKLVTLLLPSSNEMNS